MKDTYEKAVAPPDTIVGRIRAIPIGKSLVLRTGTAASIRTIVSRLRGELPKATFATAMVPGGVRVSRLT